jgi:hypothetical protein
MNTRLLLGFDWRFANDQPSVIGSLGFCLSQFF